MVIFKVVKDLISDQNSIGEQRNLHSCFNALPYRLRLIWECQALVSIL